MCGISVVLSNDSLNNGTNLINAMSELIAHRGPDARGNKSFYNNKLFLGHNRLSIVDLTQKGNQPLSYQNEEYWIIFNGEVYNFKELKEELIEKGYSFNTETDTEVILAAYSEWGEDCLNRFNGEWAIVIYDVKKNKLFICRDRFGIKPLYYTIFENGMIAFASEIKQFTVLPGWNAQLNGERIYDFLYWGLTNHTQETMFKNVFQVGSGSKVSISLNENYSIKQEKWYKPEIGYFTGSYEEAQKKFRGIFEDAIKMRLQADVEPSFLLSGGLDSSSIVCLADSKLLETSYNTFSARSTKSEYDEGKFIDIVLQNVEGRGNNTYPNLKDLLRTMDVLTWHQDEPFGSTSIFASWKVYEMVGSENKIVLDGQGADELLAGYKVYFGAHIIDLIKNGNVNELLEEVAELKTNHGVSGDLILKKYEDINSSEFDLHKVNPAPKWLNLEKLGVEHYDPYENLGGRNITLNELSQAQVFYTNLPSLLRYADRNSMAHSVEARLPFLDHRLVEFLFSLPGKYKMQRGNTKAVLRDAMEGILPEEIRNRQDKMGFVTPEEIWFKEEAREEILLIVNDAVKIADGILTEEIITEVESILDGKKTFSFFIWRIISFKLWMEKFNCKC